MLGFINIAACADFIGTDDYEGDIEFTVEVNQDENITRGVIENRGPEAIDIEGQGTGPMPRLERREDGSWVDVVAAAGVPMIISLLSVRSIDSGESYSFESPIETQHGRLSPGEYRYNAALFADGHKPLPDNVRISDTFRIE